MLTAMQCHAFTPCRDESRIRLTLIESPLPWLECAAIAGEQGMHWEALGMAISGNPACYVRSAGSGWIVAWPGVADWVLGREVRHAVWGDEYVLPGVPVFGECGR